MLQEKREEDRKVERYRDIDSTNRVSKNEQSRTMQGLTIWSVSLT